MVNNSLIQASDRGLSLINRQHLLERMTMEVMVAIPRSKYTKRQAMLGQNYLIRRLKQDARKATKVTVSANPSIVDAANEVRQVWR